MATAYTETYTSGSKRVAPGGALLDYDVRCSHIGDCTCYVAKQADCKRAPLPLRLLVTSHPAPAAPHRDYLRICAD